eukprot:scaffold652_cov68-Phaeocystis_antarctica.AAC.5
MAASSASASASNSASATPLMRRRGMPGTGCPALGEALCICAVSNRTSGAERCSIAVGVSYSIKGLSGYCPLVVTVFVEKASGTLLELNAQPLGGQAAQAGGLVAERGEAQQAP